MPDKMEYSAPHIPVLLDGVLKCFADLESGSFVDCTLGYAGHSFALLQKHPRLKLIGIDRDSEALQFSSKRLAPYKSRVKLIQGSFSEIFPTLREENIVGVLADFGVSSLQLDKVERGFSFQSERLDMRMDPDNPLSAFEVVNSYSQEKLEKVFREYGEIREAKKVASAIVRQRALKDIESGKELAKIAIDNLPKKGKIHPGTLLFQAIRIEVNNELGEIVSLLDTLEAMQPAGATIALITFHSLEDRLVKQRFKKWAQNCICPPEAMRCTCGNNHALGRILTNKPLTADSKELKVNPRSRSAKLRCFRFNNISNGESKKR